MEIETLKRMIGMMGVGIADGKAYISNRFYNALIIYNIQEGKVEKAERFVHMDASSFAYHGGCVEHNGTVYFFPDNGYGVHAYHVDSGCQKHYDFGFCQVGYARVFGEELVLFPWHAKQGLLTIDLNKETGNARKDWWDADRILGDLGSDSLYSGAYDDDRVWSHCVKSNCLLITDYRNRSIEKYTINTEEKLLYGSAYDGNDFWFTAIGKDVIYQWNINDGLKKCYSPGFVVDGRTEDYPPCRKIACAEGHVFLIPCNENALFLLNKETGKMEKLSQFPAETIYPRAKYWGVFEKIYKNKLYLFCDVTDLLIQVDLDNLNVRYINTQIIGDQTFEKYVNQIWGSILSEMRERDWLYENGYDWKTWLSNFMRFEEEIHRSNTEAFRPGNIGGRIYREVMQK